MYRKVLVAYDGSDGAKVALERAVRLARIGSAELTMVWVRSPLPHHVLALAQSDEENDMADEFFNELKKDVRIAAQGQAVDYVALYGDAAREIVRFAEKKRHDLIVCGQTGHSDIVSRMLGQTADRISETAKCDVLVVRRPDPSERNDSAR